MTNFLIQTDMSGGKHSNPLFWTESGVVGILRADEASVFETREEAEKALSEIKPNLVRFYDLVVLPVQKASRLPAVGGNGWMVRHPGYDCMH